MPSLDCSADQWQVECLRCGWMYVAENMEQAIEELRGHDREQHDG